jgi:hypothetical protein
LEDRKHLVKDVISRWGYFDLSQLLHKTISAGSELLFIGSHVVTREKASATVDSLQSWTSCFTVYLLLLIDCFPSRTDIITDRLKYMAHFAKLCVNFTFSSACLYDERNRRKLAGSDVTWSDKVDDILRVECLVAAASQPRADRPNNRTNNNQSGNQSNRSRSRSNRRNSSPGGAPPPVPQRTERPLLWQT